MGSYPQTDIFLICFAINNRWSFENVTNRWVPELKHHMPNTPFILVGTKSDLRNDTDTTNDADFVTLSEANILSTEIGARTYVECSAMTGDNVKNVFKQALEHATNRLHTHHI